MKDKLETISIILVFAGMILSTNANETTLYVNFIGVGTMAIGMLILHAIGRNA